mmetsp:Transcript_109922/g.311016  ORF Transcript_109922/g.311016 Transcript_109922/m.311016 type:complete len:301 (+) Transcript_109922:197-1099(+)
MPDRDQLLAPEGREDAEDAARRPRRAADGRDGRSRWAPARASDRRQHHRDPPLRRDHVRGDPVHGLGLHPCPGGSHPDRVHQRQCRGLRLQRRRPGLLRHALGPQLGLEHERKRHLGLDRHLHGEGVRARRAQARHGLRRHLAAGPADRRGQDAPADIAQLVARHQGLQRPRLRRERGEWQWHAGLRPHEAPAGGGEPNLPARRPLQPDQQRAQHRDQRGLRDRLHRGRERRQRRRRVQRRPAHGGHFKSPGPRVRRLLLRGRVHARRPVRHLRRPRCGTPRQGDLLLLQRGHGDDRRRV